MLTGDRHARAGKAQSAMEYLMTYGWAILIIAVVLGILYFLGVFNSTPLPLVCLQNPPFLCSNPQLNSDGALTITFGYFGPAPITITGLLCNITPSSKYPSEETTRIPVQPGQTMTLTFQCPLLNTNFGSSSSYDLWIFYDQGAVTGLQQNYAKGFLTVSYVSVLWNVTVWQPSSSNVDLLPYSSVTANPELPVGVTVKEHTTWESLLKNNAEAYSFSTDYHMNDIYFGIETTVFPSKLLAADNASCTKPYSSHGYSAIAYVNLNGNYNFTIISDDGTEIFYRPASGGTWHSVFNGVAWKGEPPTQYGPTTVNFANGTYELAVDWTDICDPAGLSAVAISPPAG